MKFLHQFPASRCIQLRNQLNLQFWSPQDCDSVPSTLNCRGENTLVHRFRSWTVCQESGIQLLWVVETQYVNFLEGEVKTKPHLVKAKLFSEGNPKFGHAHEYTLITAKQIWIPVHNHAQNNPEKPSHYWAENHFLLNQEYNRCKWCPS